MSVQSIAERVDTEPSEWETEQLPNVHPGDVLRLDFLEPMGISPYRLAKDIGVSASRVGDILLRRRAVSADTALRLAYYFGTSARLWLNLQAAYDLEEAERQNTPLYQQIQEASRLRAA